jgi:hypothetical protein
MKKESEDKTELELREVPKRLYAKVSADGVDDIIGKILTYADMAFQDPEQRRAFKSSAKGAIWAWWHSYELFTDK